VISAICCPVQEDFNLALLISLILDQKNSLQEGLISIAFCNYKDQMLWQLQLIKGMIYNITYCWSLKKDD
jgi:hypothetical protein